MAISNNNSLWNIVLRDGFHRRVYIEPLGTAFTLDTGIFNSVSVDWSMKTVQLVLSAVSTPVLFNVYRLHVNHLASCNTRMGCDITIVSPPNPPFVRGAFEIPIHIFPQTVTVQLQWSSTLI